MEALLKPLIAIVLGCRSCTDCKARREGSAVEIKTIGKPLIHRSQFQRHCH